MTTQNGDTRPPAVAGQFYPANAGVLERALERCYAHPLGPGRTPKAPDHPLDRNVGLAVPHAGIDYSGPVAAHAYARLAVMGKPKRVILLGPDHFGGGTGVSLAPWRHWQTPMGDIPVDFAAGEWLRASCSRLRWDPAAHAQEHAIEVQLPFLAHLFQDSVPLVPISMTDQSLAASETLAKAIAPLLEAGDTAVIASSDLSHYLPDTQARETDRHALAAIESMSPHQLERSIVCEGLNMCGVGPVATMLIALGSRGAARAEILAYGTSADTSGRRGMVVGYAAAATSA